MRGNHFFMFTMACLALTACATTGDVQTVGSGVYRIQRNLPAGSPGRAARRAVLSQAEAFCRKQGGIIEVHNEDISNPATRTYQLTFQCPKGVTDSLSLPVEPLAVHPFAGPGAMN